MFVPQVGGATSLLLLSSSLLLSLVLLLLSVIVVVVVVVVVVEIVELVVFGALLLLFRWEEQRKSLAKRLGREIGQLANSPEPPLWLNPLLITILCSMLCRMHSILCRIV